MENIHIFTDSTADIPRALCERYGIEIVPVTLKVDGRTLREFYDVTPEEYWAMLAAAKDVPVTSLVTPAMFLQTYRAAQARGCTHVLGFTMNAAGSGTYQSALIARELFYDEYGQDMEIEVLDSGTYTYIYGRVAVLAARMRADGESFEALCAVARSRLSRCECVLGVYTLKYLRQSGRISGGAAFVGEALGLRPISLVAHGAVTVMDKVRGDKNLPAGVLRHVRQNAAAPETQTADLLYGDVPATVLDQVERSLLEECGFQSVMRWPIGASVITNTGPQAFAVAYYGRPKSDA